MLNTSTSQQQSTLPFQTTVPVAAVPPIPVSQAPIPASSVPIQQQQIQASVVSILPPNQQQPPQQLNLPQQHPPPVSSSQYAPPPQGYSAYGPPNAQGLFFIKTIL